MDFCLEDHAHLSLVAGTDEAGRGPLAGDVVAAAVILHPGLVPVGLDDSKKLSEHRRETLFETIREQALAWCVGRASVEEIDSMNILHASMLAMHRAVDGLKQMPELVYVDGNRLPPWSYVSTPVIKGDSRIAAIAAASVLAKVTRDREMRELDSRYPGYGFAVHKGYPTRAHLAALECLGASPAHRRSFGPVARLCSQELSQSGQ